MRVSLVCDGFAVQLCGSPIKVKKDRFETWHTYSAARSACLAVYAATRGACENLGLSTEIESKRLPPLLTLNDVSCSTHKHGEYDRNSVCSHDLALRLLLQLALATEPLLVCIQAQ
eukprot:SAG31_NODE_2359_length_5873_cov_2.496363_5_plen_116_part_00